MGKAREAKEAELMTASELNEEVVKLRAQLKSAEDNFTRIEEENAQARELAEQLRTDVVKKQNEIIREKKEQDRLKRDIESITKESDDLKKSLGQAEKRLTDHRTSTKEQERLLREQKSDIEKKTRENKIMGERINKLK